MTAPRARLRKTARIAERIGDRVSERVRDAAERAGGGVRDGVRDATARARKAMRPRRGAKRTLLGTMQQIPQYLRLLGGLLVDRRVSAIDKVLVGAAIAYILTPIDFIPDFLPFLGEVDDVFLLVTALQRLVQNAGRSVLLDHWTGSRAELSDLNLHRVVNAASFFLPLGMPARLRRLVRGRSS